MDTTWHLDEAGAVVANVVLGELDATKNSIRAVPEGGVSVVDPAQEVDLAAR